MPHHRLHVALYDLGEVRAVFPLGQCCLSCCCIRLPGYDTFLQTAPVKGCNAPAVSLHSSAVDAGWSSLAARRAHNPKVVGSNPTPATNQKSLKWLDHLGFFLARVTAQASRPDTAPGIRPDRDRQVWWSGQGNCRYGKWKFHTRLLYHLWQPDLPGHVW
jgi:hypothetical protein